MAPKRPNDSPEHSSRLKKKKKTAEARVIHFQSGPSSGSGALKNSTQFYSLCAGMSGLPAAIDIEKFTEARSFEIAAMQSAMESAQGSSTQRAWQALPRSLRRRAASHDVRRVPVRLREKARAEMDPVKRKALGRKLSKRGNSKHISRTQSFLKRQHEKSWLETHIWHAKRMHMKNIWGYRLAETPTEKSYRPSHRSAIHSSIIHDASYMSTISVSGKQFILEKVLSLCCDCQGAGPAAVRFTLGSRIHETHLYKPGAYPFGLIAPVTVMWKPVDVIHTNSDLGVASNKDSSAVESTSKTSKKSKGKRKEDSVLQTSTKPDPNASRTFWLRVHPSAWSEAWSAVRQAASLTLEDTCKEKETEEEVVDLIDLRSQVNCFELTGPRSSQVFKGAITPVAGQNERSVFQQFWSQLKDLQTPGSVPRGMIVGLKVQDPRLNFPPKNVKAEVQTDGDLPSTRQTTVFSVFPSTTLAKSELWDEVEREGGSRKPRFQKKDLDERRQKNLVPGTPLEPLRHDDRVPLLVIQRTLGSQSSAPPTRATNTDFNTDIMHGWTILFPAHWSMPFFTSLIHTGTRVAGLRERRTQSFEAGVPDFPFDYPLTPAYQREATMSEMAEKANWNKKPPAKRVDWETVGTRSPWRADWEVILGLPQKENTEDGLLGVQRDLSDVHMGEVDASESMWLLRGPETPNIIAAASSSQNPGFILLEKVNALRAKKNLSALGTSAVALLRGALVQVKLNLCGRGNPDDLAAIYEVGKEESERLRRMLLKKRGGDIEGTADDELSEVTVQNSVMIGYVTTGKYSLSRGRGHAIGAVSAARLIAICARDTAK
ncbi:ribonucleases P/MRP protein subunit POP1-domain-containing protein [Hysterangium stoloniferum]|nr:ribonucleases P/MRP protein subunit POP1-domain-containing protein [Hysterangium stoloniferum]